MKLKIFLLLVSVVLAGCASNPKLGKTLDEMAQRFGGKKYTIEPVEGETDQYKITVYNADVRKRRLKRQQAMADVCPYSKIARVLAEKDDHKLGKTQVVVWCETK